MPHFQWIRVASGVEAIFSKDAGGWGIRTEVLTRCWVWLGRLGHFGPRSSRFTYSSRGEVSYVITCGCLELWWWIYPNSWQIYRGNFDDSQWYIYIPHLWTNPNQRNQGFRWHGYWVYCRGCCEQTDDDVWEESARFCDPSLDRPYSHMAHGAFPEAWRGTRAFKIDRRLWEIPGGHLFQVLLLLFPCGLVTSLVLRISHFGWWYPQFFQVSPLSLSPLKLNRYRKSWILSSKYGDLPAKEIIWTNSEISSAR